MNIEIIGGDPATQKAVQVRLAERGFASTVAGLDSATLDSHADPCHAGPLPGRLRVFFPSGDICTDGGQHVASVHLDGWSNREVLGWLLAAAPETAAERDRLKASNAELLAALHELLETAENMPAGTMRQHCGTALRVARAAIAQAERGAK